LAEVQSAGVTGLFLNFLVGGVAFGVLLGLILGIGAYFVSSASRVPDSYQRVVDVVVRRYLDVSIRDAEAVRARLLRDPIYGFLLDENLLPTSSRTLDLGCGRGIVAALGAGAGPGLVPADRSYLGVDVSDRYVRVAREALDDLPGPTFQSADLRDFDPPPADLVLLLNVLRYLPRTSQDALLRRLGKVLPPGARLLVWEVDRGAGWRFRIAIASDALLSLLPGRPHRRLSCRRASDLRNALLAAGFEVRDRTTAHKASRAHVLLEATRRPTLART
jgi:SAM-dependent methyltransferase